MLAHLNFRSLLLAGASVTVLAGPAFALDGKDMMDKIVKAYGAYGAQLTYDSAETDGNTVTVSGVKLKVDDAKNPVDLPIGNITFDDVTESGDGGYTIGKVTLADVDFTEKDTHVSAKNLNIENLVVPAEPTGDLVENMALYKAAHVGPVSVEEAGKPILQIASFDTHINKSDDNSTISFDTLVSGLSADLSEVKDPKSQDAINKLGLKSINGNVTVKGSWEAQSGKVDISQYSMDFDNIGKLNFTFNLSGYTPAFIKAMKEATEAAAANPDKQSANATMGMTMLGLLQQLTFNSASLRFDDASITKRVLDYAGSQQGVTGEQYAQSIKGMLPLMMAKLNMPDLQRQVSEAVNSFLDNPEDIEIKATPAKPVAFPVIMGSAMGAPQALPQILGVSVTANQ